MPTNKSIQLSIICILVCFSCKKTNWVTNKDENGNITEKYQVDEAQKKHGEYQAFINGALIEKSTYNHGLLNGTRQIYHSNGALEIEETYENDVIIGDYISYFIDGKPSLKAKYIDGKMQGELKAFYKSGALKESVTMVDNEENGPFKEFHENGKLKWEGQFLNGDNEFGLLQEYDSTGQLIKKMMCDSMARCTTTWTKAKGIITPKNGS